MEKTEKKIRAAVYCRKSVEDDVEKEFNSIDAQREAGEMYVASQRGNGWICLPERYEDYGFSGGNMNRPGLKKLLADCEAGLVDIVVVYKVDRLSRSIIDFGELSKQFEAWNVAFVSVTQEINTSTSSGRMMLNILMTFAQYEREVIAERVRDKMRATRTKGKWVGGTVPMGYKVVEKKLVPDSKDAEIVRRVFQRYIEIQAPKTIAQELNHDGLVTKQGNPWTACYIYRMLNNHTYIGEVYYKEAIYSGEHDPIIARDAWDRVHEIMKSNAPVKEPKGRVEMVAPLKGILRCGHCDCSMMPVYGKKKEQKFNYYICGKDVKRAEKVCPVHRIPAGDVEEIVFAQLAPMLKSPEIVMQAAQSAEIAPHEAQALLDAEFWATLTPGEKNRLMTLLIERAIIYSNRIELEFKTSGIKSLIEELKNAEFENA